MAQPAWLKKYLHFKPEVNNIFDGLEEYREFCVQFGHVFNEADLGNEYSPHAEMMRTKRGKYPRDNWGWLIKNTRMESRNA